MLSFVLGIVYYFLLTWIWVDNNFIPIGCVIILMFSFVIGEISEIKDKL